MNTEVLYDILLKKKRKKKNKRRNTFDGICILRQTSGLKKNTIPLGVESHILLVGSILTIAEQIKCPLAQDQISRNSRNSDNGSSGKHVRI